MGSTAPLKHFYSDLYTIQLPEGHRFPIEKYRRTREVLVNEGTIEPDQILDPGPCDREVLELVHDAAYVDRTLAGGWSRDEERRIGFPWSDRLIQRSRHSVQGTIRAAEAAMAEGAGANLAGGTHHAHVDRGEGFCIFNDVAVAIRKLQRDGKARKAAVIDLDVHQGNGTAAIFRGDSSVFTFSMHARNNWPFAKESSSLDIELDDRTGDIEYLRVLDSALDRVLGGFSPDIAFYVAGVDPLENDRLGRLALTIDGLHERDRRVISRLKAERIPVAIVFGGGYSERIDDLVEAHANTCRVAAGLFPG